MRVFIGYDPREHDAALVAKHSMVRRATVPTETIFLRADRLRSAGLVTRTVDDRFGSLYDLESQAPQATEFANSRFVVPLLAHSGWVMFIDCDMLFLGDVAELREYYDSSKAVMVVKHNQQPTETAKMINAVQTRYPRKNWSSVVLWNCDHPANRRLTLDMVNNWPGRDLHAFGWLHDSEIGELPPEWNWLVGVQPKPVCPKLAHYTLGGPWFPEWSPSEYDDLWLREKETMK